MHDTHRLSQLLKTIKPLIHLRYLSILLALFFTLATGPGCSRSSSDTLPDSLVGIWTTTDPRYAGRFLDLRPHSVTFGLGENGQSVRPVSSVEWTSENGRSVFTVHYEAEDGAQTTMSFLHSPFDATLTFKNQSETIWSKKHT